jgi:hypothetical protein
MIEQLVISVRIHGIGLNATPAFRVTNAVRAQYHVTPLKQFQAVAKILMTRNTGGFQLAQMRLWPILMNGNNRRQSGSVPVNGFKEIRPDRVGRLVKGQIGGLREILNLVPAPSREFDRFQHG